MPRFPRLLPAVPLLILLAIALQPPTAHAQATATATRVSLLSVFAEYQNLHPDYGQPTDPGVIVGLNYTRFFRSPIVPSFEVRGERSSNGQVAGEEAFLGGVRVDVRLRRIPRLSPYANFLVGAGQINFAHPVLTGRGLYVSDNSIVYNYGGGVDYDLDRNFAVQAEFQYQNWNLGGATFAQPLTPYAYNVGVRYHIPFRARNHR